MKRFNNYDEYETWTNSFENPSDYETIPAVIDDGWKISMDMMTECKSYKTALRRFKKAFEGCSNDTAANENISAWIEGMKECCENGCFYDLTGWMTGQKELDEQTRKYGTYNWSVEEIDEGRWYIYLNISGGFAGR